MSYECCVCLNKIEQEDDNIFNLECCSQIVHHDCIVKWINTTIDRKLTDYNKCILCKSYNASIEDYYIDLQNKRRENTYTNLDNSTNLLIINVDTNENVIRPNNTQALLSRNLLNTCYSCAIGSIFISIYFIIIFSNY